MPSLSDIRHAAYFASVGSATQAWGRYLPTDHPFLQSWLASITIASRQSPSSNQQALQQPQPTSTWAIEIANTIHEIQNQLTISQDSSQRDARRLALPMSGEDMLTYTKWTKLQHRISTLKSLQNQAVFLSRHLRLEWQRAQFLSKTGPGASAFLRTIPSDRGLTLANDDFTLALYNWLRLPILPRFGIRDSVIPCCCARASTSRADQHNQLLTELHLLNCHDSGLLTLRHHSMTATLAQMCRTTALLPMLEPLAGSHHDQRLRYDLAVDRADGWGRDVRVDVSIRNPLARKLLTQSSKHRLYAAQCGVDQKKKHYAPFVASDHIKFIPAVLESFGALHPETSSFVAIVASRVNNLAPEQATFAAPTFTAYWIQRISVCLQRENSRLIRTIINRSISESHLHEDGGDHGTATYNPEDLVFNDPPADQIDAFADQALHDNIDL